MAEIAVDSLPYVRDILRELDNLDRQPVTCLVRGRSGTGKSTLLTLIRSRLRGAGVAFQERAELRNSPSRNGSDRAPGDALIIDDAHTLSADELDTLCAVIAAGGRTVVVATQPRPHDPALRALAEAMARGGRVLDLRPLGTSDLLPFARELGMMVPRPVAERIHQQTGGIRGGVVAALSAACSARLDASVRAVDEAVATWVRTQLENLEPDLLETLAVATTGSGLDAGELTDVLGLRPGEAHALIDRARATALVTDADLLLEPAIAPLRTMLGDRRFVAVQRRLLGTRLEAGLLRDNTALMLAESGVRDPRLAGFLTEAAERHGDTAARYYAAATTAGADPARLALRWAEAAALAGDGDTAMRLAEPVLADSGATADDMATAVRICAGVLTRRGLAGRAAKLYRWLGADRVGPDWAVGATVLNLTGDPAGAHELSASAGQWPPTEAGEHTRIIATALGGSLDGSESDSARAISALIQTVHADAGIDRFLPCGALPVAALLSLSAGQPHRAGDALRRAAASGLRTPQLTVLAAWTAMLGGNEKVAARTLAAVDFTRLDRRDQLLAHGAAVGLARRAGDHTALTRAWRAACPLFDDVDADLLAVLPVGELLLAGIRLHDEARVRPLVEATEVVLRRQGSPPAWSNAFHWYGVQAAIARERPDELLPPAQSLKQAAEAGDRHAAVLADAGRTWVLVLRGEVDLPAVTAAVTGLSEAGLIWDAARLASEAALAAADSPTATTLLKMARTVRTRAQPQEQPAAPAVVRRTRATRAAEPAVLSDREREVAELVLLGLTYREIGARLYISAKTVEHHIARIRRRIGAGSRSELLSMLRAMGHGSLLV
ncbi:LuxR C-terminal-related transcriptional regulator [Nocardia higoensis]|uniref:LuxR C-terminal-related transcriptional regulator n=1 Tax=Nocardia higoensis TaxID=228599 RepID=UPI0005938FBD|nr:LuxR C-terminal-related transcriptional regulator [Nocardia higoensis]